MSDRAPRYTLQGPCESWALQGRDGVWYRVCVPCDTVIPAGGSLPRHLAYGYRRESDAWMSVRGHVRDMAANRVSHLRALERERRIIDAARRGDLLTWGREVSRNPAWVPGPTTPPVDEMMRSMAGWLVQQSH
jgi:hypothetical protein